MRKSPSRSFILLFVVHACSSSNGQETWIFHHASLNGPNPNKDFHMGWRASNNQFVCGHWSNDLQINGFGGASASFSPALH